MSDRCWTFLAIALALFGGGAAAVPLPELLPGGGVKPIDEINRIDVRFSDSQRFGIVCPKLPDPRNPDLPRRLTRDERGITNNTIVRIEGYEYLFGLELPGVRYVKDDGGQVMKQLPIPGRDRMRSWQSAMEYEFSRLRVTQSVEVIVGEQTRLYDTALVRYRLWNRDNRPHTVGLRIMLDTFIGTNDGFPWYVAPAPGKPARFVDTMEIIPGKEMPDFLHCLEGNDLKEANAVLAVVGLKVRDAEPVDRLVLCRWPQNSEARWGGTNQPGSWQFEPIDKNPNFRDSCVVLYWAEKPMKPDETRELAFTYGLGRVLADVKNDPDPQPDDNGKIRLFVGNRGVVGKPVTVTAFIKGGAAQQKVTLKTAQGLKLADESPAEQQVPPANRDGYAAVTWQVLPPEPGRYLIEATAPGIGKATESILVYESSLFE